MTGNEPTAGDEDGVDLSSLPEPLLELIPQLDRGQAVALQAYLEIHNHHGEFPLHLTVEALDELVPGFAKDSLKEALKDTRDERRRINFSTAFEVLQKFVALIAGWGVAIYGTIHGVQRLSQPDPGLTDVIAGGLILAFCIGGPASIAYLMRNSGINLGIQTKISDEV